MSDTYNFVRAEGVVKLKLMHDNVTEYENTLYNTWSSGIDHIARVMAGTWSSGWAQYYSSLRGIWFQSTIVPGAANNKVYYYGERETVGGTYSLVCKASIVGPFVTGTLLLSGTLSPVTISGTVYSGGYEWAKTTLSAYLTIPTGWTLDVEWRSTLLGTGYAQIWMGTIIRNMLSSFNVAANSCSPTQLAINANGTVLAVQIGYKEVEIIDTSGLGNTFAVVYKGTFLAGVEAVDRTNIGSILLYSPTPPNEVWCTTTFSPFTKSSLIELDIEHRNTILDY